MCERMGSELACLESKLLVTAAGSVKPSAGPRKTSGMLGIIGKETENQAENVIMLL